MKQLSNLIKQANILPQWDNDDQAFIRRAIAAEADAINLYLNQAKRAKNPQVKEILLHLAKDEKEHLSELQLLLETFDDEQIEVKEKAIDDLMETMHE